MNKADSAMLVVILLTGLVIFIIFGISKLRAMLKETVNTTVDFGVRVKKAKKNVAMLAKFFGSYEPIVFQATEFKFINGENKCDGTLYLHIITVSFLKEILDNYMSNTGSTYAEVVKIELKNDGHSEEFITEFLGIINCEILYNSMISQGDGKLEIYYPIDYVGLNPAGYDKAFVKEMETFCRTLKANGFLN